MVPIVNIRIQNCVILLEDVCVQCAYCMPCTDTMPYCSGLVLEKWGNLPVITEDRVGLSKGTVVQLGNICCPILSHSEGKMYKSKISIIIS